MEKWRMSLTSTSNEYYNEREAYEIALYWSEHDWGEKRLSTEDKENNRLAVFGTIQERRANILPDVEE